MALSWWISPLSLRENIFTLLNFDSFAKRGERIHLNSEAVNKDRRVLIGEKELLALTLLTLICVCDCACMITGEEFSISMWFRESEW